MIVYASRLELLDKDACANVMSAFAQWLNVKCRRDDSAALLAKPGKHMIRTGEAIEVVECADGPTHPRCIGIRYSHPDRRIRNREWLVEVGVEAHGSAAMCTVLLQTRDASARTPEQTETTQPKVVREILRLCQIASSTPGLIPRKLEAGDSEVFRDLVRGRERSFPIIQISPCADGTYFLHPEALAELLAGIAEVFVIPVGCDTIALADALGSRLTVYNGAVNIVWPAVPRNEGTFVPISRFVAAELGEFRTRSPRPENEILATVCHRTNQFLSRQHLSPEAVLSLSLRAALDNARASLVKPDPELEAIYRSVDEEQRQRIAALESIIDEQDRQLTAAAADLRDAEFAIAALKHRLEQSAKSSALSAAMDSSYRERLAAAIVEGANLENCLAAIELLFPDRIVVLETARASARKAKLFNNPRRAFELLLKLVTDYYEAMTTGKGDAAGKSVFGTSFAPCESERVEANKRARSLRTFRYNERDVEMMRHLRIGVKDSIAETFRAHFHWDADLKRIVLGHCGKHLDHG